MKKKIYIETSFISYLCGKGSDNLIIASNQKITHNWWETRRMFFELLSSELVFQEIEQGDSSAAQKRLEVFNQFDLLEITDSAKLLARAILARRVLPAKASADALHIAIATVSATDYLLTWNCKHIANAEIQRIILRICSDEGFSMPTICTPLELMGR